MRFTSVAIAGFILLAASGDHVSAKSQRMFEAIDTRTAGEPIMAIVSLRSQRITIYDTDGWILRAPVSSGQKGRETPAGIFSVIQKDADHHSNLYDDAYMPHMQRITWSGIALHGGPLPGYPASHGCVRMPFEFAAQLFDTTRMGMRVIVAPSDVTPVEIAHPALFSSKSGASARGRRTCRRRGRGGQEGRSSASRRRNGVPGSRAGADAGAHGGKSEDQRRRAIRGRRARARLPRSRPRQRQQAEEAKAEGRRQGRRAAGAIGRRQGRTAAEARCRQRSTREAAVAAESARAAAAEAAREVARELEPVSVFISRKTQRLYVRRAFEPVLESPVTILGRRSSDRHACLHRAWSGPAATAMRWNVVSLDGGRPHVASSRHVARPRGSRGRDVEPVSTRRRTARMPRSTGSSFRRTCWIASPAWHRDRR